MNPHLLALPLLLALMPMGTRSEDRSTTEIVEALGRTQCIGSRKCSIAPVPLHPVVQVLVVPGSRVKKGQVLVRLDDDEAQADVRAKQAALERTQLALQEARHHLATMEEARTVIPDRLYHENRFHVLKAEQDERAARAELESAKAELEHYTSTAQIEGVVSWLNVHLGMVSRPGTTVWGEILDLRELDVRCELTLAQVEKLAVGQRADVYKRDQAIGSGSVVFIGIEADPKSERVPVHVRVANPDERLRCGEPVRVQFRDTQRPSSSK